MMNAFKRAGGVLRAAILLVAAAWPMGEAHGGPQMYEPLSASVRNALQKSVADQAVEGTSFESREQARAWILAMSPRLRTKLPDSVARIEFLRTVHYEALRAGLDPQLVLAVIQVESNFRKYAVSTAGARGYMQVMPFWVDLIGTPEHNLFHLRTNLRYGCLILRHYLDIERGNLTRALGRYNGSLGKLWYPSLVQAAWKNTWQYVEPIAPAAAAAVDVVERQHAPVKSAQAVTATVLRR
jgi:soluble lytic murein transglycosylase-like protein